MNGNWGHAGAFRRPLGAGLVCAAVALVAASVACSGSDAASLSAVTAASSGPGASGGGGANVGGAPARGGAGGAGGLSCNGGETPCDGRCVDTLLDPANCGACAAACGAGYVCSRGACVLPCNGTDCNGSCVDVAVDPAKLRLVWKRLRPRSRVLHRDVRRLVWRRHDRMLGPMRRSGERSGELWRLRPAVPGRAAVRRRPVPGRVRTRFRGLRRNVHRHGARSPELRRLRQSVCRRARLFRRLLRPLLRRRNREMRRRLRDLGDGRGALRRLRRHVPGGNVCTSGTCAPCSPGKTLCGGKCVDTQSDSANCGSCGISCQYVWNGTATCSAGACAVTCAPNYADCDGAGASCEASLSSDSKNCGSCGHACASGQYCSSGVCTTCSGGDTWCGYSCVDTTTNTSNCGACNHVCPYVGPGIQPTCTNGVCGGVCYSGYLDCDGDPANGCEAYVASDPKNCGTCGIACSPSQVCSNGLCQACPQGKTPCANKCVDLTSDLANCGACGVSCVSSPPHASAVCASASCTLVCATGYYDCDGNGLNGCETAVGLANCGGCGIACGATEFCAKPNSCTICAPASLGSLVPQTISGTTLGRPDQFSTSCGSGNAPDVYYAFTAPAAGTYTFDTIGSAFNTVLEVRNGACGGSSLGCNDDGGGAGTSKLSLLLAAGQLVIVIVDGKTGSQGTYTLHVSSP